VKLLCFRSPDDLIVRSPDSFASLTNVTSIQNGFILPSHAISPWTKPGHISHSYSDHVSILKFIEHNWGLPTISGRTRDNDPNPISTSENAYVPTNSPAIDDLFDLLIFRKRNRGCGGTGVSPVLRY
jgi:hypothetical protein